MPGKTEPRNAELEFFLRRVERLEAGTLLALSVKPSDSERDELEAARSTARKGAARTGLEDELDRLRSEILTWASAGGAKAAMYGPDLAGEVALEDMRLGAAQAIYDAGTTRLLGPALDAKSARALCNRWDSACG